MPASDSKRWTNRISLSDAAQIGQERAGWVRFTNNDRSHRRKPQSTTCGRKTLSRNSIEHQVPSIGQMRDKCVSVIGSRPRECKRNFPKVVLNMIDTDRDHRPRGPKRLARAPQRLQFIAFHPRLLDFPTPKISNFPYSFFLPIIATIFVVPMSSPTAIFSFSIINYLVHTTC